MGTRKSSALPRLLASLAVLLFLVVGLLTGDGGAGLLEIGTLVALALGLGGPVVFGLPRWARLREQQMDHIAARMRGMLGPGGEVA